MNILGLGLDRQGKVMFPATDEGMFADGLIGALERNGATLKNVTRTSTQGTAFRSEAQRRVADMGDPRVAGWSFLVNESDPNRDSILEIIQPLAKQRGMPDPGRPFAYRGEPPEDWFDWLHEEYFALALEGSQVPQYVLLVGGPSQIPFEFQSLLSSVASVGRLDFQSLDDLRTYVEKLLRLEKLRAPTVKREALIFAPDGGLPDPTYFSLKNMAVPMAEHIREKLKIKTRTILGEDATKERLASALQEGNPAIVYTASHGLGPLNEPRESLRRWQGAICCQARGSLTVSDLYGGDDVPANGAFLEGSIIFQFACFGYGTPEISDYSHWLNGVPERYTDEAFVAHLPKKLLAHPRGPIAYIGHLDTAFLHGFTDADAPHILERWHERISPFVMAVDRLFSLQPSALALQPMSVRYALCNSLLTSTYDRQQRGRMKWTPELKNQFVDRWITRSDAQNYMVLGDPAARLRLPD